MYTCNFSTTSHTFLLSSYWTDNGACYHYYNSPYDNYEDLLIAVKKYADENAIPFRYVQVCTLYMYVCTCLVANIPT